MLILTASLKESVTEGVENIFILRYSVHVCSIVHGEFVSAGRSLAVIDLCRFSMQILSSPVIEVLGYIFIQRYSIHVCSIVHGEFVSAGRSLAVIDLSQDALTLVDDVQLCSDPFCDDCKSGFRGKIRSRQIFFVGAAFMLTFISKA